jgi:hypothetical protein
MYYGEEEPDYKPPQHMNAGPYDPWWDVTFVVEFKHRENWAGRVDLDMFNDWLQGLLDMDEENRCEFKNVSPK